MNKHFSLKLIGNLTMALVSQKFSNDNDSHDKLYFFSSKVFNPIKADFSERWEKLNRRITIILYNFGNINKNNIIINNNFIQIKGFNQNLNFKNHPLKDCFQKLFLRRMIENGFLNCSTHQVFYWVLWLKRKPIKMLA